jgi:predicted Zn-dependent protease with MMP-like domain
VIPLHIDDDVFAEWVSEAVELLPRRFRDALQNITVDVEDLPSRDTLRKTRTRRGDLLLGLYVGVPLTERSHEYGAYGDLPDRIVLYKRSIEDVADTHEEVREEVALTLLHEVGHYFGMTEDQLTEFELLEPEE